MKWILGLVLLVFSCADITNSNYFNDKIPVMLEVDNTVDGEKVEFSFNLWTLDSEPKQIQCHNDTWLKDGQFKVYAPESGFCVTVLAYAKGFNGGVPTHKSETYLYGPVVAFDWGEKEHVYELNSLVSFE